MPKTLTIGDAGQKEFVKVFDTLTGKYNRWEVWRDMITMTAVGISNSVDGRFAEAREKLYLDSAKKYTREELLVFSRLFGLMVNRMEEKIETGLWGDFLGELFMGLELGSNLGGQFFTPYHLCLAMARLEIGKGEAVREEIARHGWASVADVACGAGATLIAGAETLRGCGVDYQRDTLFAGQEIDQTTALMCYIQLSLLGCAGYVVIGDSLAEPMTGPTLFGEASERCWYTPMYFSDVWAARRAAKIAADAFRGRLSRLAAVRPHCAVFSGKSGEKEKQTEVPAAAPEPPALPAAEPTGVRRTGRRRAEPEGQISMFGEGMT